MFSKHYFCRQTITKIFIWQIFLNEWASTKIYLTDEIIERPLKKENTSKKNNNIQWNKNENLSTTNLVSSIYVYHWKIYLLFFFVPIKICWKHVFFETMQSHCRFISSKRLFLTFGNLTVIKCKNLCESK